MKAIDSKILVKKEDQKDSKLTERLGGFEVPAGAGEYETYRVISVGAKVEGVVEGDLLATYVNPGHQFTFEGDSFRVISVSDILVVL